MIALGWRRWRRPAPFLLFGALSTQSLVAQEASGEVQRSTPIEAARSIIVADNAGDLDAVVELYAADVELWPPGEPPVRGAALVEARYKQIFNTTSLDLRTRIIRVREGDDWALVEGELHGSASPKSGGDERRDDKYFMVLERAETGGWEITHLMWSPNGDSL